MTKLNLDLVRRNVAEAGAELERIEAALLSAEKPREHQLQVWFDHAFHHLNFAGNARHATVRRGIECADEDFNRWGRFPADINLARVTLSRKRQPRKA